MNLKSIRFGLAVCLLAFTALACGSTGTPADNPVIPATATPTPTPQLLPQPEITPTIPSACAGVSGELEVQVLVGPGEAAGLKPVSVGRVPLSTPPEGPPYPLSGSGRLTYNEILTEDWGSYTVTFDMDANLTGECLDPGTLTMSLDMSGSQNVAVRSPGLNQDYPWSGTVTRRLSLPLQDGAGASGEGWAVVLHLR